MRISLITLTAATVLGTGACAGPGASSVQAAEAAVGANPGDSAALYVELDNRGGDDELVSASCDCTDETSLHLTEDRDGVMLMVRTDAIDLPGGERVELLPGGAHVMLEELDVPLERGSSVQVTLSFEESADLELDVPVVSLSALAERVERTDPDSEGSD